MDEFSHLLVQFLKSKNLYEQNPPWEIQTSDLNGKGLFANRNIQSGEIIFKDAPLIVGPRSGSVNASVCVSCNRVRALRPCSKSCGLPVCSVACENSETHKNECRLISNWKSGRGCSEIDTNLLKCLAPIRTLLLSDSQIEMLKFLKCHDGHRHGLEVSIIKERLKLNVSPGEEAVLRWACLLFDTNAFEVVVEEKGAASLRAIYLLGSVMNHSCIPNTTHIYNSNQNMIVKASVPIPKGREIFHCYTMPSWGTYLRRSHLLRTKHFFCTCLRCQDPTENHTFLSAINCPACSTGLTLPLFLKSRKIAWKCMHCNHILPNEKAKIIVAKLGYHLNRLETASAEEILEFLQGQFLKHAPASNEIAVQLKFKLIWMLGHQDNYLWKDVSLELLGEKETICRELLQLLATLGAGQSKMRGLLLYELYSCLKERQRRLVQTERNIAENDLKEMEKLFEESREILGEDVHAPQEIKLNNSTLNSKGTSNQETRLAR